MSLPGLFTVRTRYVADGLTLESRYLPAIGRFLIVVTFLEDTLRIMTQWSDQLVYLRDYRKSRTSNSFTFRASS